MPNSTESPNIQDHIITGYRVEYDDDTLVLYTKNTAGGRVTGRTAITFTGYIGHVFANEGKGSALCSIEGCSPTRFMRLDAELVEDLRAEGWWPFEFSEGPTFPQMESYMNQHLLRPYQIDASPGMYGWVIAKAMQVEEIKEEPNQ